MGEPDRVTNPAASNSESWGKWRLEFGSGASLWLGELFFFPSASSKISTNGCAGSSTSSPADRALFDARIPLILS
jgi:hypothetical protein